MEKAWTGASLSHTEHQEMGTISPEICKIPENQKIFGISSK